MLMLWNIRKIDIISSLQLRVSIHSFSADYKLYHDDKCQLQYYQ